MKRLLCCLVLACIAWPVAPAAVADEQGEIIRNTLDRLDDSVVRVRYNYEQTTSQFQMVLVDGRGGSREKKGEGICQGIVLNDSGLLMIGGHIFPDPNEKSMSFGGAIMGRATSPPKNIRVDGPDGQSYEAEILVRDEDLNIAFLSVKNPPSEWKPIEFDYDSSMRLGDPFMIMTFLPKKYDYQASFETGRVTGVVEGELPRYLQGSIMSMGGIAGRGESMGGAVVSLDTGSIVGFLAEPRRESNNQKIESSGLTPGGARQSFSISIAPGVPQILPASVIREMVKDPLAALGEKGWIGIEQMQPLSSALASYFGRDEGAGAIINLIGPGSPADNAGLRPEDILIEIDGKPVMARDADGINDIMRKIRRSALGTELALKIIREGVEKTMTVPVVASPRAIYDAETEIDDVFGVTVAEITYDVIQRNNLDEEDLGRVIVRKVPVAGWFNIAGLVTDDIVLSVNDKPIDSIASFRDVMKSIKSDEPKEVMVKVKRGADTRFIRVEPEW